MRTYRFSELPKARPVKMALVPEIAASVQRSIDKLPVLGARNPDGQLIVERVIDDLTPSSCFDEGVSSPTPSLETVPCVSNPALDTLLDDTPPLWWWTDPEWVEHEMAFVQAIQDFLDILNGKRLHRKTPFRQLYLHVREQPA